MVPTSRIVHLQRKYTLNHMYNYMLCKHTLITELKKIGSQASKAALISFCETLRAELGWDIGVTIVTPGVIKTKLAQRSVRPEDMD